MSYKIDDCMVIGVSSRALFDLSVENSIFENEGVEKYREYQIEHENDILKPGPGFALVKSLLELNNISPKGKLVEVIIMSRNSTDTSLRVFNAISHYGLDITRAVLSSGAALSPYLEAFHTDLFLSAYEDDVQAAIDSGIAAGIICTDNIPQMDSQFADDTNTAFDILRNQIRIAFDADAVVFTDASEKIYKEKGLEAFEENERINANTPLEEGPFANFLKKLSALQKSFEKDVCPIRTALVTARSAPAHERVIRTLRAWDVRVDESFFLGGIEKKDVLKAFKAQIFFDDQSIHTIPASKEVPAARVPYKGGRCGKTSKPETG